MSTLESYYREESIAAVATPSGEGGISIVRVSGDRAYETALRLVPGKNFSPESHRFYYRSFIDAAGVVLDKGMFVFMKGPRSYTGEDVIEFHCHGGKYIAERILEVLFSYGISPAKAGEFTFRAFLNGKMDLAQAEAVQHLISAKNKWAHKFAKEQLEGFLSDKIQALQKKLVENAAVLEALVDFPEEGLEYLSIERIIAQLKEIGTEIATLLRGYEDRRARMDGFSLALVGAPNAGKSSLMNCLLKKDRAIVSSVKGTTRDLLEEPLLIEGIPYRLIDTAGIRDSEEEIEKIGIAKARQTIERADLLLLILDASRPLSAEDRELAESLGGKKVLAIGNKIDIAVSEPETLPFENRIFLSAKTGENVEALYRKIKELLVSSTDPSSEGYLTDARHKEALLRADEALQKGIRGLEEGVSPEWSAFDIKEALHFLRSIIGGNVTEDILTSVFSKFCIGK